MSAGSLLVLRYRLGLTLLNELLVATLGYQRTSESPGCQVVVPAFIVYAPTFGKTLAGRVWRVVMVVGFVWSFSYSHHPEAHGGARRNPRFSAKVRCGR